MSTVLVRGERGMARLGAALAKRLRAGDVVWLVGEMGAGKSVFARGVARELGVTEAMPSPSFTILQAYEADLPIRHFDLYRLESPEEFFEAGLDEQMGPDALSLVEWPENAEYAPAERLVVSIRRAEADEERLVSIEPIGMGKEREKAILDALERYEREERGES